VRGVVEAEKVGRRGISIAVKGEVEDWGGEIETGGGTEGDNECDSEVWFVSEFGKEGGSS
jgi:hypothetical protein